MPGKRSFGSIRQLPSGRWQIRYRTLDSTRVTFPQTFARKAEALRVLAELLRQKDASGPWLKAADSKVLFGDYAERWLEEHPGLRPRTREVYASILRRHILPFLGGVQLGRLTTATIREWRRTLTSEHVSDGMIAKSYRLTRAILNTAVSEDELITTNPCRIKGAGQEQTAERPVLSIDQVYQLADLVPERWKAFILLKTFASLRWGEITALTRHDIDLESNTVHIRRQLITVPGGLMAGPPKSRAGLRTVTFPAAIMPELQHHLDRCAQPGDDGLIFVSESGQPMLRGNFNKAVGWTELCRRLGRPGLHLHDLRHTGNTIAAQSGASLRDLMSRMGHDSPAAALIYQHASRAADQAIAAAFDAKLQARLDKAEHRVGHVWGTTPPEATAEVITTGPEVASD